MPKLFCLAVQEEEHIPSLLTIQDINASMADVALELATRKCFTFSIVPVVILESTDGCCSVFAIELIRSCAIWPLSGTSSISNNTVRFTSFFVYSGDHIYLSK